MTDPTRYRIVDVEPRLPDEDVEPPLVRRTFTFQPYEGPSSRPNRVTLEADHPDLELLHYADTGAALELRAGWLPPELRVVPTPAG